jgi:hypothetical protein
VGRVVVSVYTRSLGSLTTDIKITLQVFFTLVYTDKRVTVNKINRQR